MNRAFAIGLLTTCAVSVIHAQEPKPSGDTPDKQPNAQPTSPPAEKSEEQLWAEAAKPGIAHQLLDFMVGSFDVTCKVWSSPQAEPQVSQATAKGEWVLGGRYVKTEFSGEIGGAPINGIGFTGFDNLDARFVSIWMTDASTNVSVDRGYWRHDRKQFIYDEGQFERPTGGVVKTRTVVVLGDDGQYSVAIFHTTPEAPEMKVMQFDYQRRSTPGQLDSKAPGTSEPAPISDPSASPSAPRPSPSAPRP